MKKRLRLIVSFVLFSVIFWGCEKGFQYILIDDTASYTRITFHEMYEQDNIDVLFVGSSHCYRSFIPEILDEELKGGVNTFNAGTSAQYLDGSYMIIKEAAKYNNIKHIYLELYYDIAFAKYKDRTEMTQTYIISDYLRPSLDKVLYLLNASSKDYYVNSFILARRNWEKFFETDYVKDLIVKKSTDEYRNYEYAFVTGELEWYAGKGYIADKRTVENWNYFSDAGWNSIDINAISEDWLSSLRKIIKFCDKNDISLTLISTPMPDYLLIGMGNYDEYVKFVREFIVNTDIDYYDFNLCKEEYFPNESFLFKDEHHLNCYGAEVFSHLFADFVNGKILEEKLFYNTYIEKIENLDSKVLGVSYHNNYQDPENPIKDCKIVSIENDSLEYEISIFPDGGDEYVLQYFSNNRLFTIASKEHGKILIKYRLKNFPDHVQRIAVFY